MSINSFFSESVRETITRFCFKFLLNIGKKVDLLYQGYLASKICQREKALSIMMTKMDDDDEDHVKYFFIEPATSCTPRLSHF